MKRTPFKRKPPAPYVKLERIPQAYARLTVPVNYARFDTPMVTLPKDAPVRHEGYRRLTAMLPCAHCGVVGHSQAAHADFGKGAHIKSDDRTCYPACADRPGVVGCHSMIGGSGSMSRDQRRHLEAQYARDTREIILLSGHWPDDLPLVEESETA